MMYKIICSVFFIASLSVQSATPKAIKVSVTYPNVSAYVMGTGEQLSGQQFQTDGIITYKGYQYTVYYNKTRNVCIARRKMPVGVWQEVVLSYKNSVDDAHNVITIGISPNDGRIHLAYDHHNDDLHYCYSIAGSANNPDEMPWQTSSFSATTNIMDKAVPNVTYPRFIAKPDGNLLFECRFRWSGYGDSYLREYNADTQKWSLIGRYVQGEDVTPDACAYINGMTYDKFGKLHVTWCWRDDYGGGSNHDFYYAYSADHGRTWKDTFGDTKASSDVMDPVEDKVTRNALGQTKKTYQIEAIPYNRGYINQETQDVDSRGRIHAVNSHIPDGQADDSNWANSRTKSRLYHRFRKEDGTWVKRLVTVNGVSVNSIRRVNLAIDSYDNAYIVANGYGVLMASPDDDYAVWTLLSEDGKTGFYSEPLTDRPLLRENGVLSFVYLSADGKITVFDYLTKNPNTPIGTGLKAQYYSNENFTGLISEEIVPKPDQSAVPAGTKSIRWSGAFETIEGEKYSLYLNTSARTDIYVNDKLQKIITKTDTSQEYVIDFSLIASHKNNIVIESVSATPITLSWSSASTPKQIIPSTSLYPQKPNDAPEATIPPALPTKKELSELIMESNKNINSSSQNITVLTPFNPVKDFSVEVKAKINSVDGRGLDIEARTASGKGFRISLDKTSANFTAPLASSNEISPADNSSEQTYRIAVKDDKVHVYRGLQFLGTRDAVFIKDIKTDGTETDVSGTYGANTMSNWAGPSGTGTATPTTYGWSASVTVPWNTAGGGSGVRYESVNHAMEGGGTYSGRLMTIRWDGSSISTATYFYPVTLEANKTYEFSFLYEYWSNATTAQTMTVGVSKTASATGIFDNKQFVTSTTAQTLRSGTFLFSSQEAGTYYITFAGTWAMYGIGKLEVKSLAYENRLQFGKNYPGGNLNADVYYVSFQDGAYAPTVDEMVVAPNLPEKVVLPLEIQNQLTINTLNEEKNISTLEFNPSGDYSVEIAAKVNAADGRGLDVEVRNGTGNGFRTSLSPVSFRWASPFTNIRQITSVTNERQVIRYAVQNDKVHLYRNGTFVETFNVSQIGNMDAAGTTELAINNVKPINFYDGVNKIANADFKNDAHNAAPTGWISDKTMGTSPNPRVQEKSQTTELSAYPDGKKAFMFRFDASGGTYYAYPVTLKTNKWHEYSFDLITWGENQSKEFDVVIATVADGSSGIIATQTVQTPAVRATGERKVVRFFTATDLAVEQLQYYLIFKKATTFGTTAVTDLYLKEGGLNQILFGKNYTSGSLNADIDYIKVDYTGAFAPSKNTSSVQDKKINATQIFCVNQQLHIRDVKTGTAITIFDLSGRKIIEINAYSDCFNTALNPGIYIVNIGSEVKKVAVF